MPDLILEDAIYTSRWKRAFVWNFFLCGLLTPFLVIAGHHFSQQQNRITHLKGKAYKSGAVASFIAVVATYVMLSIAMPVVTGLSIGQVARAGADAAGRGWRAGGEWIGSLSGKRPEPNTAAQDAEKKRAEAEALNKEAAERERVLAERHAAEERVAKELELKRQQAPSAIVAPREKSARETEEELELARFASQQQKKKSDDETRVAAQQARRDAQAAAAQLEQSNESARKAKAALRNCESELAVAQRRVATLSAQRPRPVNHAELSKLYQDAVESAQRKVAAARNAISLAERELSRAQSTETAAQAKANSFGNVEPSKPAPKPQAGAQVYRLKDGRDINPVKVVDLGEFYGLKDESGKVITVPKTEVWDISEP